MLFWLFDLVLFWGIIFIISTLLSIRILFLQVAHNLARHAGEKISGGLVVNLLARILFLFDPSGVMSMLLLGSNSLLHDLPNSREAESEADQIGIHLAAYACYDPRAAKRVFA